MDAWVCGRWNVPEAQPWPGMLKAHDRERLAIPQVKGQSSDTAEPQSSPGYLSLASLSDIQHPKVTAVAQEASAYFSPYTNSVPDFPQNIYFQERTLTCILPFPIHIFCQKQQQAPHGWISCCCTFLWTTTYNQGSSADTPRTPATYRHTIITEILISVLRIPLFCGCVWKFHQMQIQSIILGSEGGKKQNENPVLIYTAFQFSSQWMTYCPWHPIPKHQPPSDVFSHQENCAHSGGVLFNIQHVTVQITCKSREDAGPKEQNMIRTKSFRLQIIIKTFLKAIKLNSLPTIPLIQI